MPSINCSWTTTKNDVSPNTFQSGNVGFSENVLKYVGLFGMFIFRNEPIAIKPCFAHSSKYRVDTIGRGVECEKGGPVAFLKTIKEKKEGSLLVNDTMLECFFRKTQ